MKGHPNLWDTEKAVLRGKFIAIQSYFRKQEKFQINSLTLQQLERQEQTKLKSWKKKRSYKDQRRNKRDTKKTIKD